jgi:transposase-like protein
VTTADLLASHSGWRETMTKAEQSRLVSWRLRMLRYADEVENISQACRHFGISRQAFHKWKARFAEHGEAGLCDQEIADQG